MSLTALGAKDMATVLHSAPSAKVVRCKGCGEELNDDRARWWTRCVPCEDAAEARKSLEAIIDSGDEHAIAEAASWLQFVQTDAAVFRSARVREYIDRAAVRAVRIAEAEAVRTAKDPILVGADGDDD
jgi:ribosomal protein S26